ncbi:MAG: hypothetical protein M1838_000128 [Thelocarpon superellum]|nr:MAG: hypothetical protein M1838_000128 [Thelocarpon superellum]
MTQQTGSQTAQANLAKTRPLGRRDRARRVSPNTKVGGAGGLNAQGVDSNVADQKPSSSNAVNDGAVGTTGGVDSSVGADPTSGQNYQQKQQGADRPAEEPSAEGTDAINNKKNTAEQALDGDHQSGEPTDADKDKEEKYQQAQKGTGEQWVKTSGVAADGGDFDATKPGAGREADRLLEAKGVKRTEGAQPDQDQKSAGGAPGGTTSKVDKIKEKLHIG